MTYPAAGSGVVTRNFGPSVPNGATQGAAPPFPAPGTAANVAPTIPAVRTYNLSNSISSTREALNSIGENVPQQGTGYVTNAAQVLLAGLRATDFAYYAGVNGAKG